MLPPVHHRVASSDSGCIRTITEAVLWLQSKLRIRIVLLEILCKAAVVKPWRLPQPMPSPSRLDLSRGRAISSVLLGPGAPFRPPGLHINFGPVVLPTLTAPGPQTPRPGLDENAPSTERTMLQDGQHRRSICKLSIGNTWQAGSPSVSSGRPMQKPPPWRQ